MEERSISPFRVILEVASEVGHNGSASTLVLIGHIHVNSQIQVGLPLIEANMRTTDPSGEPQSDDRSFPSR